MNDPNSFSTPPPLPASARRPGWGWRVVFAFVLFVSLTLNLATCGARVKRQHTRPMEERPVVKEELAYGRRGAPVKAAILGYDGMILRRARGLFGGGVDPVTTLLREIQAVTMDEEVKAILLEVNSPGGGVTASDEIYAALMRFKESDPDRRVVVQVLDLAASGGYYISLPADVLVAQPTSVVGSVGVMLTAVNLNELADRLGIQDVSLTSAENKALLSMLQPVDPAHREILQRMVDDMYDRFRELVVKHRPFDGVYAEEHGLLDGRVFTARDALQHGLVDETGYPEDAREAVRRLVGEEEVAFYRVTKAVGWPGMIGARFMPNVPGAAGLSAEGPQFQYLWRP